ncbi:hypothetical protein [Flavobacterium lindanitolerans]|uniref:hypothetical protein n=1 Tax=Flavobacterium lindanitolerans TaxID=428988 RepID=UPI002353A680|nr:hypothetical protein [Flavobacterium lindanitolerans]
MNEGQRTPSLKAIFERDIEGNSGLNFRTKTIRPVKGEEPAMQILFKHLTCEEIEEQNEDGTTYPKRVFEIDRSVRLHWVRYHIEENRKENIEVFSVEERDQKKRKDVIKTYIYDTEQEYIIVLEPQRSGTDYYLLTAYYLNRKEGKKSIQKKLKNRLADIH